MVGGKHMKSMVRAVILAAVAFLVFSFVACSLVGPNLVGTEWTHENVGTGTGLKFTSETSGHFENGVLGVWAAGGDFTYSYSVVTKSGTLTANGSTDNFTVSDNQLTYLSVDYTKK
jgi:hypothetical protein